MLGIHDRPGSFSDRWIAHCIRMNIPFRLIDCLSTEVVPQCQGLDGVLWHWSLDEPSDVLVARQIIASLQLSGHIVFPNVATCWHYDDKVAQKYLFEAIGAPLIPSVVFTSKREAMQWIERTAWPKVFKLRCGAGSTNVRLVRNKREAEWLCRRAFGRGFPASAGYLVDMQTRLRKTRTPKQFWDKIRGVPRVALHNVALSRQMPRQRGYVYFQEFLPDNPFDTRITVIGERAFGFRRANRPNDFRASGSGSIAYDPAQIDKRCLDIAFKTTNRLAAQSLAFDFLFNHDGEPLIGEISYCYLSSAIHDCQGHWDPQGGWHEGHLWPEDCILEDMLATIGKSGKRV